MKIYNEKAIVAAFASAICILPSCSNSDDNNHGLDYDSLTINFAVSSAFADIDEGVPVGLFATCTRDDNTGFSIAGNACYITAKTASRTIIIPQQDPLSSNAGDHNFHFMAYYPYTDGVQSPTAISVTTPAVQEYAQGADAYNTYVASASVSTIVPTVDLEFKSVNAMLEIFISDDIIDEEGGSTIRTLTITAPEGEALSSPLVASGSYDLTSGVFTPDASTASDELTIDFGPQGLKLNPGNTAVLAVVSPFTIPAGGLTAHVTDVDGYSIQAKMFDGVDAGTDIKAGETRTCYIGRVSDGIIPVTFPVEWTLGYANGAYIVSAATQPQWLTQGIWSCPAQPQAFFQWYKVSDPSDKYTQKLEFVNSASKIGSVGIKGIWTGDYFEATIPVKRFAANTPVTVSFPMYTRQGPVFWDIEYLDGDEWKCNRSRVTSYDPNYSMDCTFSAVRGTARIRHTMVFENAIKSGYLKFRIKCADGSVVAAADATCAKRDFPFTDSSGYGAPFYFYDATMEMTSIIVSTD